MDVLTQVLDAVRLSGTLTFCGDFAAPWGFEKTALSGIPFHIVQAGEAWLHCAGADARQLEVGDSVFFPTGAAHSLASGRTTACMAFPDLLTHSGHPATMPDANEPRSPLRVAFGDVGARTQLLSGIFALNGSSGSPLLQGLPPMVIIPGHNGGVPYSIQHTASALLAELDTPAPGSSAIVRRLGEILFVQMLRRYIVEADTTATGWLLGVCHPQIGRALMLIHAAPERFWTIPLIASELGTSRSRLAEAFSRVVGQPLGQYLTAWRMQIAAQRLASANPPGLADLARQVGYRSDVAFAKAFKRWAACTPRAYRLRALDLLDMPLAHRANQASAQ
ncbi:MULTISPECIES: AraC family transcriptional regulator [unclassified Pseudomonas]|uniref:AraC family transcriptional regulator n=1 Tax=unclassified Pseudomonas TaxID=196821 RepID=UPI0031591609